MDSYIIIIQIQTYLLYTYLVLNDVFIPRCIVKAFPDDISSKLYDHDCITLYINEKESVMLYLI